MKNIFIILFSFLVLVGKSQNDSTCFLCPAKTPNKSRVTVVVATEASLYAGSLIGLNSIWYKDYSRTKFHYFNDNDEWEGMDKVGHTTTAYYVGRIGIDLLHWSGVKNKKAAVYGGLLGFTYQTTIELLDGFSSGWGFSWGDMAANTLGSAIVIGQELGWKQQRITLKYSYSPSGYAQYRPNLLGSSFIEKMIKDYNGQTYWLSVNVYSFLNEDSKFPKWLNVAMGYGADGMTGGTNNPPYFENGSEIIFKRYSQYYLSLDIDLTRIKTKSKFLKTVFETFGFIKFPAPALEISNKRVSVNPFGF